nr:reverse transcriptase domain-containing protein [Tanacetum cinerariifolium]
MSTRLSARNLFSPLDNPELTIQRRSRADPTILNDFEMAAKGNGDLPVPDLRTMEELCQPSLNGRGGPIAPIAIQETNFGLKNDMIQQVQNSCQFHGLPGDDANKLLDKFLHVTQSIKVNRVTDDALRLYLFPHSLTHHATAWFDRLPRNSIKTFKQMAKMFLGKYFPPSMVTKLRNEITNFRQPQRSDSSSSITSSSDTEIAALKAEMAEINKNLMRVLQVNQQVKAVASNCENYGGSHSFSDCPATVGQTQNIYAVGAYQGGSRTLPGNTITNPKEELKGITTRSGTGYQGPMIPTTFSSLPSVVERETEATKDTPVATPVSAPKPNQRPSIPYLLRFQDQKLCEKANDQRKKFFQIFKDLNFNISFADALILMPKFGPSIRSLLTNKDKLCELARTPLNDHCLAVLLKKLPEKLGDPGKFLILSNQPISRPIGVAEDVYVKVGKFHFLSNFVVVDFDADPRVPLILERSFIKTGIALIDVFEGELTLRVGKEAITFNLDQTSRYSANYNDMTAKRIDVFDMACKEYYDFLLEEVDAFLALLDDAISSKVDQSYVDTEGDILFFEAFLNDDPSLPPPKDDDKLLVIIAKDLSIKEKTALITVLKSHKRAIAWKLSDIKGIDPEFCTHKILMEEDFEPAVQHQRRVNPKIYDVIKNEDRIVLNLPKISQKPDNINTRSKIREKPDQKAVLSRIILH